jgi:hypothetical protein
VAIPPVALVAFLPRGEKRPSKDDYESVPMVDARRRSEEEDVDQGEVIKVSALD